LRFGSFSPAALGAVAMLFAATTFQHDVVSEPNPVAPPAFGAAVLANQIPLSVLDTRGSGITSVAPPISLVGEVVPAPRPLAINVVGDFRLDVPFRTQKDGARFQGANCGPASLAMILESFRVVQTNSDLRWLIQGYMGNQGRGGGTALEDVAAVGRDFGLTPTGLYDGQDFARWTTKDVEEEIRQGRPVIVLVKYRLIPSHMNANIGYDHYVVIHGVEGDRFTYHDPAYELAEEGAANSMTTAELSLAMRSASIPGQAVAFAPGAHSPLAYRPL